MMPHTLSLPMLLGYLTAPVTWIVFLFGAIVGSFLNVCIFRIPAGTFFQHARSICPSCQAPIPMYLNVPIIGWLLLHGRARCCKAKLSPQYPLVELGTALVFVVLYWKYPFAWFRDGVVEWHYADAIRWAHAAVFAALLIVVSVIDFRLMIIPDVISLPMIALTPLVALVHPDLDGLSAVLGVAIGGLSLYAVTWLYWLIRHEVGMGMGDVKLLAAIGGWLGYQAIIPTVFYGSLMGAAIGLLVIVVSRKLTLKSAIPFGPFLALGAIIHLIIGPYLQMLVYRSQG